jgi:hypothetical protein
VIVLNGLASPAALPISVPDEGAPVIVFVTDGLGADVAVVEKTIVDEVISVTKEVL